MDSLINHINELEIILTEINNNKGKTYSDEERKKFLSDEFEVILVDSLGSSVNILE